MTDSTTIEKLKQLTVQCKEGIVNSIDENKETNFKTTTSTTESHTVIEATPKRKLIAKFHLLNRDGTIRSYYDMKKTRVIIGSDTEVADILVSRAGVYPKHVEIYYEKERKKFYLNPLIDPKLSDTVRLNFIPYIYKSEVLANNDIISVSNRSIKIEFIASTIADNLIQPEIKYLPINFNQFIKQQNLSIINNNKPISKTTQTHKQIKTTSSPVPTAVTTILQSTNKKITITKTKTKKKSINDDDYENEEEEEKEKDEDNKAEKEEEEEEIIFKKSVSSNIPLKVNNNLKNIKEDHSTSNEVINSTGGINPKLFNKGDSIVKNLPTTKKRAPKQVGELEATPTKKSPSTPLPIKTKPIEQKPVRVSFKNQFKKVNKFIKDFQLSNEKLKVNESELSHEKKKIKKCFDSLDLIKWKATINNDEEGEVKLLSFYFKFIPSHCSPQFLVSYYSKILKPISISYIINKLVTDSNYGVTESILDFNQIISNAETFNTSTSDCFWLAHYCKINLYKSLSNKGLIESKQYENVKKESESILRKIEYDFNSKLPVTIIQDNLSLEKEVDEEEVAGEDEENIRDEIHDSDDE